MGSSGKCAWCPGAESNHRHEDFQSTALPLSYPGTEAAIGARSGRCLLMPASEPVQCYALELWRGFAQGRRNLHLVRWRNSGSCSVPRIDRSDEAMGLGRRRPARHAMRTRRDSGRNAGHAPRVTGTPAGGRGGFRHRREARRRKGVERRRRVRGAGRGRCVPDQGATRVLPRSEWRNLARPRQFV